MERICKDFEQYRGMLQDVYTKKADNLIDNLKRVEWKSTQDSPIKSEDS